MYKYIFILSWLIFPMLLLAQGEKELFAKGNRQYEQGAYEEAIATYEGLVDQGWESSDLYVNLGNAYYKQNNTALSILNFERALKLDPGNEDAEFNLQLANLKVVDRIAPERRILRDTWLSIRGSLHSGQWGGFAIIMLWLGLALAVFFLFAQATMVKRVTFFGAIVCALLAFTMMAIASNKKSWETKPHEAIVSISNVYVKSSPSAEGKDLFILHEGVKVALSDKIGEWNEIRLPDGKKGWLPRKSIITI